MTDSIQLSFDDRSHRNQYLFSDHYLKEVLQRDDAWRQAKAPAREFLDWLRELYAQERAQLAGYNEHQLESNWFRPILEKLGHTFEGQATIPGLSGGIKKPDYVFFPDDDARQTAVSGQNTAAYAQSALAVGEVKRWEVNLSKKTGPEPTFADNNPMFQIDTYLRAADLDWGVLSNGRFWRLIHRDTSYRLDTYFGIDLLAALENPNATAAQATATYFWLFFRQAAFRPDGQGRVFLDRALQASRDYALALEADLRDNAYRALEQLIVGFFAANPALDAADAGDRARVYRNSLYLLYRLLFLFYGESRALLPTTNPTYARDYSLRALAEQINSRRNEMGDLPESGRRFWHRLRELFRLIGGADPQFNADLGVPRYNGGLFDAAKHPFLEEYVVGDRHLAQAIDYLAYRRVRENGRFRGYQTVDYRTLGVRQLGSIYEGLLEYKVAAAEEEMVAVRKSGVERWVPADERGRATPTDRRQPGELYLATDKGERKATGSYYTPDYIVKYITEQTLGPVVEEVRARVQQRVDTAARSDDERKAKGAEWFVEEILALNVLDPAMGSGHFLVEATNFLARALATDEYVDAGGEKPGFSAAEADLTHWKRRVVEACIYGVDKNEMAVELAKLSLWLETVAADKPLSFLDHHLRHGDSLIGAWLDDLRRPPGGKSDAAADGNEAQQPLFDESAFTQDAGLAVGGVARLEEMLTEDMAAVAAKEQIWDEVYDTHLGRWRRLADLWTSAYFGNEMGPAEYRALADRLQGRKSLMTDRQADQFLDHASVRDNDYFHWELEFPEVFFDEYGRSQGDRAGFDAVIGNPPYVVFRLLPSDERDYLRINYTYFVMKGDVYILFMERTGQLTRQGGHSGLIVQNKWLHANYGEPALRDLLNTRTIRELIDFHDSPIFEISAYPLIIIAGHEGTTSDPLEKYDIRSQDPKTIENKLFATDRQSEIIGIEIELNSDKNQTIPLKNFAEQIGQGILTGLAEAFIDSVTSETIERENLEKEYLLPFVAASDIDRYSVTNPSRLPSLIYPYEVDGTVASVEKIPNILRHLSRFETELRERKNYGKRLVDQGRKWYELKHSAQGMLDQKFIFPEISLENRFYYDATGELACIGSVYFLVRNDDYESYSPDYLLALLNSRLLTHELTGIAPTIRGGYFRYQTRYVSQLSICEVQFSTSEDQRSAVLDTATTYYEDDDPDTDAIHLLAATELENNRTDTVHDILAYLAEQMIALNKEKQQQLEDFWLDLEGVADPDTFATLRHKGKWEQSLHKHVPAARPHVDAGSRSTIHLDASLGWNEDAFKGFVKQLAGKTTRLSRLVHVYRDHHPSIRRLNHHLSATDALIDQIVYRLYGLTDDEIAIVEDAAS